MFFVGRDKDIKAKLVSVVYYLSDARLMSPTARVKQEAGLFYKGACLLLIAWSVDLGNS